jgi:multidrug resistance efflux pump
VDQLEREGRDLTQAFAGLASVASGLTGTPRSAANGCGAPRRSGSSVTNETERVEAERETFESSIAQAELMVRAAERNEGKTAIHAPISGTLSETQLASST